MDAARELFNKVAQDHEVLRTITNHSLRVMYFAAVVGKIYGCYDKDLRVAALLHDIGKIGIAKEILYKPTKLNSLEYTIVKSHCHIGNMIIRDELNKPRAAMFVRDHHERWDGTGYPRGLQGTEISLQGRLISICDAFDTMTMDRRTYKQSTLTFEQAFDELREYSFQQFDGKLVDFFIKVIIGLKLPPVEEWYNKPAVMKEVFAH